MANSRRQRRASGTASRTTTRSRRRAAAATSVAADVPESSVDTLDLKEEYAYIYRDLRYLFIVSVAIFALLLIIGFFI